MLITNGTAYQGGALTCVCLRSLTSLKRLSLQSNRLSSMEGLEGCACLEELYLSHNGITRLQVGAGQGRCRVWVCAAAGWLNRAVVTGSVWTASRS